MPFEKGRTIDGFNLVSDPVSGGFAEVFETAYNGERAAMKVLKAGADDFGKGLFAQEAEIIGKFQGHPRFSTIHATGASEDRPFIVFEWLDHPASRGAVAADQRIKLLSQICEALNEAHNSGIMHRDVHPSNFKLTRDGNWKLIDWGVSYRPGSILESQPDRLTGTYTVMSPETFDGVLNDPRSDLYSIGCCLFLIIAKQLPFGERGGEAEFRKFHQGTPAPRLADLKVEASPAHQELLDQLLEKDRSKRIERAWEVRDRLLALPPLGR